jgi:hypothetical protein
MLNKIKIKGLKPIIKGIANSDSSHKPIIEFDIQKGRWKHV